MDYLALIYFICSTYYIVSGASALFKKNKSPANWAFIFICLILSQWAILLMLMTVSESASAAALYNRLMVFCWAPLFTILLYFVLFLSKKTNYYDALWKNILLIIPGAFCLVFYYVNPIKESYMIPLTYGWTFTTPVELGLFWNHYFNVYYVVYCLLSLVILISWYRTTSYQRERLQSRLIFLSVLSILIFGSITDVLLPILGISQFPPLTPIFCIVFIAGLNYAVTRYRMMNITPEKIMTDVFMIMKEGLIITDSQDQITVFNAGAETILGYQENELKTLQIETIFCDPSIYRKYHQQGLTSCSIDLRSKSGATVHALISCHAQYDKFDSKIATVFTFQSINELIAAKDALAQANLNLEHKVKLRTKELQTINEQLSQEINEKKEKEKKIRRMIYQDSLTRLNNRRFFYEYMNKHISYCRRYGGMFSILFLDLDGFKLINDSLGHDIGDQVLIQVAGKLKNGLRASDIICRAGGDEFMILLHNVNSRCELAVIGQKILDLLQEPLPVLTYNLHISASIGIAVHPENGSDSKTLIKHADIAMYKAKALGKGCYVFYDDRLKEDLDENMVLTNDLYSALEKGEFELFYQPQMDANTLSISGFEALIRWNHPDQGLISPLKFIPLAERTGLIIPIGEWILKTAALQLKHWEKSFGLALNMGVNLSIVQLNNSGFAEQVKQVIHDCEINPHHFELEVTETTFMEDTFYIRNCLNHLKDLGVHIAIDDFGTEYSSLSYLKKLPLHRIKIPKPFIDGIGVNSKDEAIIIAIIVLALKLGCTTIAEGVETVEQYHFLRENGCADIQGYYFYQPMPASKIEENVFSDEPSSQLKQSLLPITNPPAEIF